MKNNTQEKLKTTIHFILAGVFLNGILQGQNKTKYDNNVLFHADKEIEKLLNNYEKN